MRILLVITGLGMGGAEHIVSNLADYYAAAGHEVALIYLTGDVVVSPKDSNVALHYLGLDSIYSLPRSIVKFVGILNSFVPDVVHSHMIHANILSRIVRMICKFERLVCTAHNTDEGGKFRMLLYKYTDFLADVSTNVSLEAVNSFIEKGAVKIGRMVPVPNGVDTGKFSFNSLVRDKVRRDLGVTKKQNLILAVGRLEPQKDYENFLSAVVLLRRVRDDFAVYIAGEGSLRSDLENSIKALGLADVVTLLGIRRDIPELMCAADVYVLSSAYEGFGLVVAEAMACERVVVATDCGGVREVVGEAGILVPPRNYELLSCSLQQVLSMDLQARERLGKAARQRIAQMYSFETAVNSYLSLYRDAGVRNGGSQF